MTGPALCGTHLILARWDYGLLGSVEGRAHPSHRPRRKRPYQLPLTTSLVEASIGLRSPALHGTHLIPARQDYGLLGPVEGRASPSCRPKRKRPYQLPLTPSLVEASIELRSIFKEGIFP
nr:hypothetical protein CFP56_37563 [Quercus suber]